MAPRKDEGNDWLRHNIFQSKHCLISFSIDAKYKDKIGCDMITIDACHLLLGQPWQYDRVLFTMKGRINIVLNFTKWRLSYYLAKWGGGDPTSFRERKDFVG